MKEIIKYKGGRKVNDPPMIKRWMKTLLVLFIVWVSILSVKDNRAEAAVPQTAIQFYNTYCTGGDNIIYTEGFFYFCTRSTKAQSGTRYLTIGFNTKLVIEGNTYSIASRRGGYYITTVNTQTDTTYEYNLFRADYMDMINLFIARFESKQRAVCVRNG